ncbi:hypothetical protein TRFO_19495 [Tritrichomonas foetus]|uniref:Uncharacterized protein n=1 Tax=Tritrichomonas foetus TaxID=1144522 RepID=A0A1J4KHY6_9EUKA|nr:hypothetical protein TRFO_19495 [Tritrichomonas foetus]|eukprot:OHT11001.1 hypothetical protein TRFO_19495 [Tritrichomonas foetus]
MSKSRLSPTNSIDNITPLTKTLKANRSTGRLSPPPSSLSEKRPNQSKGTVKTQSKNSTQKPQTNEERLITTLNRVLELDQTDHDRRAMLLNSAILFIKAPEVTINQMKLIIKVLTAVFSVPPPFSVITKSYRQIYFHPRDHDPDIKVGYKIFNMILPRKPPFTSELLHALMRRLTSASTEDRNGARDCLKSVDSIHFPHLIHYLALTLIPPPPHGTNTLIELAVHLLSVYKAPPPLFDDFFVTTSFDDTDNILSIASAISGPRLKDGITIFEELQITFQLLHFAPHYQTFCQPLLEALKALHNQNEEYAHQNRRFLLNHWPRNDPQKSVLFMKEATAICVHGPPPEEYIWQRFSWRSSSIQWQIAMEGLNFISQTISRTEGFDHKVLIYLLDDTIKNHWNSKVRDKAKTVRELFPSEAQKHPPKSLPKDTWSALKDVAKKNYPNSDFNINIQRTKRIVKK